MGHMTEDDVSISACAINGSYETIKIILHGGGVGDRDITFLLGMALCICRVTP